MYTFLFLLTIPELFHILSFFFLMFLKRGKEMIIKKIVILNDNIIEKFCIVQSWFCLYFFLPILFPVHPLSVEFCIYETTKRYSNRLRSICEYHSLWSFSFRRTIPLKIAVCWWKAREMSKVQNAKSTWRYSKFQFVKSEYILFSFIFYFSYTLSPPFFSFWIFIIQL